MVNDPDTISYLQYSARDLPVPRFTSRPQEVRGGNTKSIRAIAFSCDGKKVATGTEYKGLRIWNATQPIDVGGSFSLPNGTDSSPHNGHVAALAFSPTDPNLLVSGCKSASGGPVVVIWDITKPSAAVKSFKVPGDILHIDFHPNGAHFAVTCTITLRDEAFFFRRSTDTGEWEQRRDIGLGGSLGNVDSEEVRKRFHDRPNINSLRFSKSGKILCAVSNDGSVNAWAYPLDEVSRASTPSAGVQAIDAAKTEDAVAGEGRDEEDQEETKSRASTPREGSPAAEEETKVVAEGSQAEGEAGGAASDEATAPGMEITVSGEGEGDKAAADTVTVSEDVEMAEAADTTHDTVTEVSTEVDVEMTAGSSSQPIKSTLTSTPPSGSTAPSRQPTPPLPSDTPSAPSAKATPITCLRHTICHCASLLSLSLDPSGKFMAVGGQDAMLSLYDTQDWICQRTFDMSTAAIRHSAFSYDGELIAIAGDDPFIAIVSVYSKQTVAKIPVIGAVLSLVWHPKENWLAYCTSRSGLIWYMVYQE